MPQDIESYFLAFFKEFFNGWPIFATVITLVILFYVLGKIAKLFIKPLIKGLILGGLAGGGMAAAGMSRDACLVAAVVSFLGGAVYDLFKQIFGNET